MDFLFIDKRIGFLPRGRDVCEDKQIEFRILNVINVEIIKLMEIHSYILFFGIDRDYQIIGDIYCFLG